MISRKHRREIHRVINEALMGRITPCFNAVGACVYNNGKGNKCAFSVLLPPEFDSAPYEGENAVSVLEKHPELFEYGVFADIDNTEHNREFFGQVQQVHDDIVAYHAFDRDDLQEIMQTAFDNFFRGCDAMDES